MLRFYYTIFTALLEFLYFYSSYLKIKKHPEIYDEVTRYKLVRFICKYIQRRGLIFTKVTGLDNLPKEGGYIMYPNHQGRFDAVGIIAALKTPCTYVIDYERSKVFINNEVCYLLNGKRLDKRDIKNQVRTILAVSEEVKAGRHYILFPEGGYPNRNSSNEMRDFMDGCFKAATKSHCPIVPVCIYDSYKVYYKHSLCLVRPQIHFLTPIPYSEYKDMNTHEISTLVKERIQAKLDECASA